jgi:hypothetical protein
MNLPADDNATQLRERLDQLAASVPAGDSIDGAQLYRQGLRRRHRRGAAATGLIAAAAALVIMAAAIWLPGTIDGSEQQPGDGRPVPPVAETGMRCLGQPHCGQLRQQTSDDGSVDRQVHLRGGAEVSHAEAEHRCTAVWHNLYGPTNLTVQLRGKDGPWFEGNEIEVVNWSEFPYGETMEHTRCLIPSAGLEDTVGSIELPLPASDDAAGVREACGRFLGWDFSDWQVLVADSQDGRLAALLGTTGGDMAKCELDSQYLNDRGVLDLDRFFADPITYTTHDVELVTAEELQRAGEIFGDYLVEPSWCEQKRPRTGEWVADCLGTGWLSGPEPAERMVITDAAGEEHEVSVNDRWFAFAGTVVNHAAIPKGRCEPVVCDESRGELRFTVYATDGTVLADYSEDKDLPPIQ